MISRPFRLPLVLAAAFVALTARPALAGWYVSPSVKWATFAARPESDEPTPNYYGFGGALSTGYSIKQQVDLGAFGTYLPGRRKSAEIGKDDASLVSYGGEIAFRFAESVYLGFRGGGSKYRLHAPAEDDDKDLRGKWDGSSGGFSLGAVSKVSKQSFFQTTFDVMHHVLENADEKDLGKRRFDSFALSFSYVFNTHKGYLIENTIFGDFMDSLIFF